MQHKQWQWSGVIFWRLQTVLMLSVEYPRRRLAEGATPQTSILYLWQLRYRIKHSKNEWHRSLFLLENSTVHRYVSVLQDTEEIPAIYLRGHYFWITNRPTWGREPEREHQTGKMHAEVKRWRELKSDGLPSLGQPATVKAMIYSAIISADIRSEPHPGLSRRIHTEWPARIGWAWFIIQLFITPGGHQREKHMKTARD